MDDGPEAVLAALDPEQREVALATRGPVCVIAGAGTGKTRAIAHRVAYAVRTGVVNPGHVLAVTFTTRAAGELRGAAAPARRAGRLRAGPGGGAHVPFGGVAAACPLLAGDGRRPPAGGARLEGDPARRGGPGGAGARDRPGTARPGHRGRMGQGPAGAPGGLCRRGGRSRPDPAAGPRGGGPRVRGVRELAPGPAPGRLRVRAGAHRGDPGRAPAGGRRDARPLPLLRGGRVPGRQPAAEAAARRVGRRPGRRVRGR